MRQTAAPQPAWSIQHRDTFGYPVISPDGRWIVLTRPGAFYRHGETLLVVDLIGRTVSEYKPPAPGVVGHVVFDLKGEFLLGVVNDSEGYSLARWEFPAMALKVIPLGTGKAIAATLTHSLDRVVVTREDGTIGVFQCGTGKKLIEVAYQKGDKYYSAGLAISPDDSVVASGVIQPGNEFVRWLLADGSRLTSPPVFEHLAWGQQVAYTPDGKQILVGLTFRDAITGETKCGYSGGTGIINPQQRMVSARLGDGNQDILGVIDADSGQLRFWAKSATHPGSPHGYVDWACTSPDGKWVYTGDYASVMAWPLSDELTHLPGWLCAGHGRGSIYLCKNGGELLSWTGSTLDTWDLRSRRLVVSKKLDFLRLTFPWESIPGDERRNMIGGFRVGDRVFGIVATPKIAEVFDLISGTKTLTLGSTLEEALASMPVVTGKTRGIEKNEEIAKRKMAEIFPRGGYQPISVDASPDGKHLIATDRDNMAGAVSLWSLKNGQLEAIFGETNSRSTVARYINHGRQIAVGDENGGLTVFDADTGSEFARQTETRVNDNSGVSLSMVERIAASEDGTSLYASNRNQQLSRWDISQGKLTKRYECAFPFHVVHISVSPNGTRYAACLFDGNDTGVVAIGDAANGKVTCILEETATAAAFLSEKELVTNGVRVWSLD
ncbi:MAG: WD40 repeat domain-containing protein [Lacunisphaera sp.]